MDLLFTSPFRTIKILLEDLQSPCTRAILKSLLVSTPEKCLVPRARHKQEDVGCIEGNL